LGHFVRGRIGLKTGRCFWVRLYGGTDFWEKNGMIDTVMLGGDLPVRRLGFGAMRLCGQPGNFGPYPDWEGGVRLLRRAVELGVQLVDTAHAYGPGSNEELIADALSPYVGVVIATKGGVEKTAPDRVFASGRPEVLRGMCEASLRRLRVERIDLYQLHRPDPAVPWMESVGALAQLRAEGKIRHVGLSNVSLEQVQMAEAIVPIASVQNRFNLGERGDEPMLDYCERRGIVYFPWGPLAAKPFAPGAPLAGGERVVGEGTQGGQPEAAERLSEALSAVARRCGASCGQVALAWLLQRSPVMVPIPGTTSLEHLEENLKALGWKLPEEDLHCLEEVWGRGAGAEPAGN
jgi:pyridoxine 4-dehydrogenase